ncbi:serine protease [Mycoplasmopsis bovirhinis]|uniref:S8 family serine peptidase n=1 Tax=Mycoplasmopsis bovirhinis TaxID=29553 RepID=UPI000BB9D570|nr:S8 family serine peptidase [Mycoplasmopsis bovirhinis]BBA22067.1 serine protease [Mycoplasmopsis bovirhinis]
MKNSKNLKRFLKLSSWTTGFFALPLGFSFISEQESKKTENFKNNKVEHVNVTNLLISNKSDQSETKEINYGVNRFDIFGSFSIDFIKSLKTNLETKLGKQIQMKFEEHVGVISIAHVRGIDYMYLLNLIDKFFEDTQKEYRKIYNFTTGVYYDEFVKNKLANPIVENKSFPDNRYNHSDFELNMLNSYYFAYVGLDKETRSNHLRNFINSKLNIGVLEYGVVETHSKAFEWNRKHGNGLWWRNELFYWEDWSRHATQVAELIAGKMGINPSLGIVSVELAFNWNGISGEMNYLLKHTNIVNNSWGLPGYNDNIISKDLLTYNWASKYLDDLIYNNPELINIVAAGNRFNDGKNDLFEISLSKNSIIVGSTDSSNLEKKAFYSQIGNDLNHLSVVTPGGYYWFTDKTQVRENGQLVEKENYAQGTSFSAPVVTTIAGMLKQKYRSFFGQGSDSIIFKSALITGSRKPKDVKEIYTNETGFGITDYKKIEKALQSLILLKSTDKSKNSFNNSRSVYLNKGEKIRSSLAFLYNGTLDKTDIDFYVKNSSGSFIAFSMSSNKNVEVLEFTVPESGWYTFEAQRFSNNTNQIKVAITYVKEN